MAIFSVLSCVLFVAETYMPPELGTPLWMFSTEICFSTGFAMQYLLGLYTTPSVYVGRQQPHAAVCAVCPLTGLSRPDLASCSRCKASWTRSRRCPSS